MTPAEYLDPNRFPLTTQGPPVGSVLSLHDQMFLDALNHDELEEAVDYGKALTTEKQVRFAELKEKIVTWPTLPKEAIARRRTLGIDHAR